MWRYVSRYVSHEIEGAIRNEQGESPILNLRLEIIVEYCAHVTITSAVDRRLSMTVDYSTNGTIDKQIFYITIYQNSKHSILTFLYAFIETYFYFNFLILFQQEI